MNKKYQHRKQTADQLSQQIQDFHIKSEHSKPKQHRSSKPAKPHFPPLSVMDHININCRFIIKHTSNLTPSTINVNRPIPMNHIWRVIMEPQDCPICLETAVVPRMLSCGHVMCFNCMIDHRNFSENPEICPICGDVTTPSLLKTMAVSFMTVDTQFLPKENEEVVFTLMKRQQESNLALPVNLERDDLLLRDEFPGPDFLLYTRVCKADAEWAKSELAKDIKALIGELKFSKQEFKNDLGFGDAIEEMKRHLKFVNDDPGFKKKKTKQLKPEFLYFYQSSYDSSTIYTLNSLDVQILKQAFTQYSNFPSALILKLENLISMTLDHHGKFKYLNHFPEQTPMKLMECDFANALSDEILAQFKQKIENRRIRKSHLIAKDEDEKRAAEQNIEDMFKCEIAEAMRPHSHVGPSNHTAIDSACLPALPSSGGRKPEVVRPTWNADPDAEYKALLKNAVVTNKKGKKKGIVIHF